MSNVTLSPEEIGRRGQDYYNQFLRDKLEPEHKGKYLVLNIESGEYEMDRDERLAFERARTRWPSNVVYILRVGYRTAARLGGRHRRTRP